MALKQNRNGLPCYDVANDETTQVTWVCMPNDCPKHNPKCGHTTAWVAANKVCNEVVNYGIANRFCDKGNVNTDPVLTDAQLLRRRRRDDARLSLKDGRLPARIL